MRNVSSMALIQLPGGWLWNTMTDAGDRDLDEGARLEMEPLGLSRVDSGWDKRGPEQGSRPHGLPRCGLDGVKVKRFGGEL